MKDPSLLAPYRAHLEARGLRSATPYRRIAQLFLRWMASKRLTFSDLKPSVIQRYLAWRHSQGSRPVRHFYPLRTFFRWLVQEGTIERDPAEGVFCSWVGVPGGLPGYRGPLRDVYRRPGHILKYRLPLFERDLERCIVQRRQQGYSLHHLQATLQYTRNFHQYLTRRGVKRLLDITPKHVDAFGHWKRRRPGASAAQARQSQSQIETFLCFAFQQHGRSFRPPKPATCFAILPQRLLQRYLDFCRIQKGLKTATVKDHRKELQHLARFLADRGRSHLRKVTLVDLDAYCIERSKAYQNVLKPVGILRVFLRYLYLQGILPTNLARDIQAPCRFSADTRPKYLPWTTVQRLLSAMDRKTLAGKRDYAIVTLIACHGLRPREAASLRLADIEWDHNSFWLRERKNGDTDVMPLAPRAKEALKDYLAVRQACPAPEVFLTIRAPIKPLGAGLLNVACRQAVKHLGRLLPRQGAYMLRHSFAKVLLDGGATLPEIGSVLGHRASSSTGAYLRIATEDMREVADTYADLLLERKIPPCPAS